MATDHDGGPARRGREPVMVEHLPHAVRSRHDRGRLSAALALADRFLRETLGISLHPEKTRIVHVDHGFEFLGYKVKRGPGLRLPAYKRTAATNPHHLYAVPREKSVQRFREQIRNLTRRCAPVRLSAMIEVLNPVI